MDEHQLWSDFKHGDKNAFGEIFVRFHKDLYRYGTKFTKNGQLLDDMIQELFLEIWQTKEQLANVSSVKGYLFRALKFKLFREIRKEGRLTLLAEENEDLMEFSYESMLVEEQTDFELKQKLSSAFGQLTRRQQEALYLRFYNHMTYDEIAGIMDISYQGVLNVMYKSIRFLREKLVYLLTFFMISV
jgi:RNA polymerase sigma factor (sigma-70 family)